ncbi:MAG: sugar transferase [Pseudomonadota bacterium]
MLVIDLALLHVGFALAAWAYEGVWWEPRALLAAQTLLPIFLTIGLYNASYCARALTDWVYAVRQMLVALVISAALINFVAFYAKSNAVFSRVAVSLGFVFSFALMASARWLLAKFIERVWRGKIRNHLVIDDGGPTFALERAETLSARELSLDPSSDDPHMRDRLGQLLQNQDSVIVSCPLERRGQWAILLKSLGVHGELLSDNTHALGAFGVRRYDDQDRSTLVVSAGPLGMRARAAKRVFDIVMALAGLIVALPLMLLIALLIKLEDGGPVLFVQQRVGRGNQFFDMLKFRSMRADSVDRSGECSTVRDDARVTRIGRFIRAHSLDELPQLWNVLRGEMAIVGPRPHALGSQAGDKLFWEVDSQYWRRHSLRPGLTGLAQIRGHRGATEQESDLTDRLQSDLEYIAGWTLGRDIGIVLRTLSVLRHDRAY